MYIIIEGIDTAGKSTQLDILKKNHPDIIFTKEPGGTEIGTKIREMALNGEAKSKVAEMFLFLADRAEHSYEILKPNKDKIVISDRGFLSGIAYAKTAPLEISISLNIMALNGILPDKLIILKLTEEELEKRLSQKEQDNIEKRGMKYLLDIQNRMLDAIKMINDVSKKKIDILIVDATKSIEVIAKEIEVFLEK